MNDTAAGRTDVTPLMERILYEVKRIVVGQDHFLERVLVAGTQRSKQSDSVSTCRRPHVRESQMYGLLVNARGETHGILLPSREKEQRCGPES